MFEVLKYFGQLSSLDKLAICLLLAEKGFDKIKGDDSYKASINSLSVVWGWLADEGVAADDIYSCLENEHDTGLAVYEYEAKRDPLLSTELRSIIIAVSFGAWLAYQKEGQKYVPPAIEEVDENTAFQCLDLLKKPNHIRMNSCRRLLIF